MRLQISQDSIRADGNLGLRDSVEHRRGCSLPASKQSGQFSTDEAATASFLPLLIEPQWEMSPRIFASQVAFAMV